MRFYSYAVCMGTSGSLGHLLYWTSWIGFSTLTLHILSMHEWFTWWKVDQFSFRHKLLIGEHCQLTQLSWTIFSIGAYCTNLLTPHWLLQTSLLVWTLLQSDELLQLCSLYWRRVTVLVICCRKKWTSWIGFSTLTLHILSMHKWHTWGKVNQSCEE